MMQMIIKKQEKNIYKSYILMSKMNFRVNKITRDKESHYTMQEGSIHKEDFTILNVYVPN